MNQLQIQKRQAQINKRVLAAKEAGETKLRKEEADFNNAMYAGEIPSYFMELFKRALWFMAPLVDNISSQQVKVWLASERKDWPFSMISKMTEVIALAPRDRLFKDYDEYYEKILPIEMLMLDLRQKNTVFSDTMQKKKDELAGKLHSMKMDLLNPAGTKKAKQPRSMAAVN